MGRERTEGVEGQRRESRPKTIRRPLVGCREGNGAYALRRACAPRAAAERNSMAAPTVGEEPQGMSMRNEQANEKVPWLNEKVPWGNLPPDAQESGMNWETPAKGTL